LVFDDDSAGVTTQAKYAASANAVAVTLPDVIGCGSMRSSSERAVAISDCPGCP
jgi:hypothetical protein